MGCVEVLVSGIVDGVELTSKQISQIEEIAAEFNLDLVLVFGSEATGQRHAHSDLDLAIRFRELSLEDEVRSRLWATLTEAFPNRKVDLAVVNTADPLFLHQIMKTAVRLFGSDRDFAELEIYAWKRYIDYKFFLEQEKIFVDKYLAKS